MTQSEINIRTFTGATLKPYLPSIAKLRIEVFSEFPYLLKRGSKEEVSFLTKYTKSKDSIGVLVFDGSILVGVSTGMPLEQESKEIQKPFLENNYSPVSSYFFF